MGERGLDVEVVDSRLLDRDASGDELRVDVGEQAVVRGSVKILVEKGIHDSLAALLEHRDPATQIASLLSDGLLLVAPDVAHDVLPKRE